MNKSAGDATASTDWLMLVVSLPTSGATARMRIWRALKSNGSVALRDGVYLLPPSSERELAFTELAAECEREGGTAWLLNAQARSGDEAQSFAALFDRSQEYAELRRTWKTANRALGTLAPSELTRLQRKLQKDYDAIRAIDFFPTEASVEAQSSWAELDTRIQKVLSPDEPNEVDRRIALLDPGKYQARTWATRHHLWVDRVACAWLIRRFIDKQARFRWLSKPSACPKSAIGFDFDGATFTHVGDRVTFETLMASFNLEGDAALMRIATMVHQLDVGGESVPEAIGFEAVMAGARERLLSDDALLDEMGNVLDSLYAHFERDSSRAKSPPSG